MQSLEQSITNSVGYFIPYLITQKYGILYVPLIFIIYKLVDCLMHFFSYINGKNYELCVYNRDPTTNPYYIKNSFYTYITCFIETEILNECQDVKMFDSFSSIITGNCINAHSQDNDLFSTGTGKFYKSKPLVSIGINQKIKINLNKYIKKNLNQHINKNNVIHIQTCLKINKDIEEKYYKLTSSNKETIFDFLKIVESHSLKYFNKINRDEQNIKYYTYDINQRKWKQVDLNVNKTFDNLFLDKGKELSIKNCIESLDDDNMYETFGIPRKIGFIFYGPPGSGKTSTIYAIASEYKKDIYNLDLTQDKITVENAINSIPSDSIVCINDIDILKVSHDRSNDTEVSKIDILISKKDQKNELTLKDMLEFFDGYCYFKNCIIIITTNNINKIEPALIRSGRIDHKFEFKLASEYQIRKILDKCTQIKITNKDMEKIPKYSISTSEIINSIVIPNLNKQKNIIELLINYECNNNNK